MNRSAFFACLVLVVLPVIGARPARATLFRYITGEATAPVNAAINADGSLTENGINYVAIYKPSTPPPANVHPAFINSTLAYNGTDSIGFEIDPTPNPNSSSNDKTQLRVSYGGDSSHLTFDTTRYMGFAVRIPAASTSLSTSNVQIAQWWQGSPYGPPLSLTITSATQTGVHWQLQGLNDTTLGNPSSPRIILGSGTIAYDTWAPFVVMTYMDFNGGGHVQLWQGGTKTIDWTGAIGYDPATIPYKNPPAGTANPNPNFDVFIGPYRNQQNSEQVELFDEVRWADTFGDAVPVAGAAPEPASAGILGGGVVMLFSRRRTKHQS